jgi:hypothetical protein
VKADAAEEREAAAVGVEHHLLALARIGPDDEHPAVAEPQVRHLHLRRHAGQHHRLVAPVELVGLARIEGQGHEHRRRAPRLLALPAPRMTPHRIVAADVVRRSLQLLVKPHQRQPLAPRLLLVRRKQCLQRFDMGAELRHRLDLALVGERALRRLDRLAHRLARHPEAARDLADRELLNKMSPPDPSDRLHRRHPLPRRAAKQHSVDETRKTLVPYWKPITASGGPSLHADFQFFLLL